MQILNTIDNGTGFDWGKASADYAKYRDIYPDAFYEKIIELGLCTKGQRVLDLGTGTGVLPRNMYKYGAEFVGADISENQIKQAKILSEGMNIEYVTASAETIDFPDNTFDAVTACQCFMYFNKETALPKIHKALKPNGHLCILFMAYLPFESEIAAKSEELILKYNHDWSGACYKANREKEISTDTPDWCGGMFETEHRFGYDLNVRFTRESWNGRMKACRGMGASSLKKEEIEAWEREHIAYLNTMPEEFDIPHWVTVLNLRKI